MPVSFLLTGGSSVLHQDTEDSEQVRVCACVRECIPNVSARVLCSVLARVFVYMNSMERGHNLDEFTQSPKGSWEISGRTGMDR